MFTQSIDDSQYRSIVVLTGAGLSVASGIRPFRGPGGIWEEHPELMELATAEAVEDRLDDVWRQFAPMREQLRATTPNAGHLALADLERRRRPGQSFLLITQNVDGLHQRAGSREVVEIHGSLSRSRCVNDNCRWAPFDDENVYRDGAPDCPRCGQPLRPDVVFFGESLPRGAYFRCLAAVQACDLFLAVGTSGTVIPASLFVEQAPARARRALVNLEPMDPPNRAFGEEILGPAEEILPRLFRPSPG